MIVLAKKQRRELIFESVATNKNIDRTAGVIYGVRVLGERSRNRRIYTEQCMINAIPLYEGRDVMVDHEYDPDLQTRRKVLEGWGVLRDVRYVKEEKCLRGDLHYLKSHEMTPVLLERIERFPDRCGLSHAALPKGKPRIVDGWAVYDALECVDSVDFVRDAATNATLFEESRTMRTTMRKLLESIKAKEPRAKRLLEAEDVMDLPAMDAEVEAPPAEEDAVDSVVATMISSFLSQGYDKPTLFAKIKKLLDALIDEPAAPAEPAADAEATPAADATAVTEAVQTKRRLLVLEELDRVGMTSAKLGEQRMKVLLEQKSRESVAVLLESWKPSKPPVGPMRQEAASSEKSYDEIRKDVLSTIPVSHVRRV